MLDDYLPGATFEEFIYTPAQQVRVCSKRRDVAQGLAEEDKGEASGGESVAGGSGLADAEAN